MYYIHPMYYMYYMSDMYTIPSYSTTCSTVCHPKAALEQAHMSDIS